MKTKINVLTVGLLVLILAFVLTNVSLFAQSKKDVIVEGTVVAVAWDDNNNVTSVAISFIKTAEDSTEEDYAEEYQVANNEKGKELLKLVGETVIATGTIETDEEGYITIYVTDYEVIKEEEPEEQEPEEIEPPEK